MFNAQILETAGFTETEIDLVFKALKRKQKFGLQSLSAPLRRLYLKAQGAEAKVAKMQAKNNVARTGRQPVETKLHYRWTVAETDFCAPFADTVTGEIPAMQIIGEEKTRALEIYQPVLDQVDTSKRRQFTQPINDLMDLAASVGRLASFDWDGYRDALHAVFPDCWKDSWYTPEKADPVFPVLEGEDAVVFRAEARSVMEKLTREVYPSVVVQG